jgi:hypothetical protein
MPGIPGFDDGEGGPAGGAPGRLLTGEDCIGEGGPGIGGGGCIDGIDEDPGGLDTGLPISKICAVSSSDKIA